MLDPKVYIKLDELLSIVELGDLRELIEQFKRLDELSDEVLLDLIKHWKNK